MQQQQQQLVSPETAVGESGFGGTGDWGCCVGGKPSKQTTLHFGITFIWLPFI